MTSDTIRHFKEGLERDGLDYRPVTPITSGRAHILFTGSFQGNEVIWDAEIVTLAHEFRELYPAGEQPATPSTSEGRRTAEGRRVAEDEPASKPAAKKGQRKPGKTKS